jgi:hypothetical protein
MNGPLVNYLLFRVIIVSETEYDLDVDTDLDINVVKKIIKDAAKGIDEASVTEYEEPFNG